MYVQFHCTICNNKEILEIWEHRQHIYRPYCPKCNNKMNILIEELDDEKIEEGLSNECRV